MLAWGLRSPHEASAQARVPESSPFLEERTCLRLTLFPANNYHALLARPKAPTILDVRREAVRAVDPRVIPGARLLAEADLAPERFDRPCPRNRRACRGRLRRGPWAQPGHSRMAASRGP